MSSPQQIAQEWLTRPGKTPALRRARELAYASDSLPVGTTPQPVPLDDARRIWSLRLKSVKAAGKHVLGLEPLVRRLKHLTPDQVIQEIAIQRGQETGVIFFAPATQQLIGAVVTVSTPEDRERSRSNYERAIGILPKPARSARTQEEQRSAANRA